MMKIPFYIALLTSFSFPAGATSTPALANTIVNTTTSHNKTSNIYAAQSLAAVFGTNHGKFQHYQQQRVIGDLNIRFNKIPIVGPAHPLGARLPLRRVDYPIQPYNARWLRKTGAISVFLYQDCKDCVIHPQVLLHASRVRVTHPNGNPNSPFWEDLRHVIQLQIARINNEPVERYLKLPKIWQGYNISQVAEAVHDEYPGSIHEELIKNLMGGPLDKAYGPNCPDCILVDRTIIPSQSDTEFIRGMVMLSDLNTWAFGMIGPMNFSVKWFVGRARPEEVVWQIYTRRIGISHGVPRDIVATIQNFFIHHLGSMQDFTAYPEGSPDHPSFPAMHSASSAASLWLAVVMKLSPQQWCEVKAVDYAIAYARTVAGVHYPTDNIAGLNIGQEIMAKTLPTYLAQKYGSNPNQVLLKVQRLRFDWNTYLTSECFS